MFKNLGFAAISACLALASAACAPSEEEQVAASQAESMGMPAPLILSTEELSGQTFDLKIDEVLVITESTGLFAEVSNPEVAEFSPAHTDGATEYNASVRALKEGATAIQLSDGTAFNLKVS